jgi:CheY-like chemotaxis protein
MRSAAQTLMARRRCIKPCPRSYHLKVTAQSAQPAAASSAAAPLRVLIVEDNPHIVEMYSYVLQKLPVGPLQGRGPLELHFAADGQGALAQLLQKAFQLVLLDLSMPVLDGFALIARIRAQAALRALPLVAISAGGRDTQERALASGVDIFLRKPVRFAELLETVKKLLDLA